MAQISVIQFASELGLPPALLLEQLQAAGVKRELGEETVLTETDKAQLLDYLRQSHGAKQPKTRITLTRRQTTEIKKADSTGKARTIQVEVRKKRTFVKRDDVLEAASASEAAPEVPETAPEQDNGAEPDGPSGMTIAHGGDKVALQVSQADLGRVAVWGDEWVTYDSEWADVDGQQVEHFWLNLLKWLSPPEARMPIRWSEGKLATASRTAFPSE